MRLSWLALFTLIPAFGCNGGGPTDSGDGDADTDADTDSDTDTDTDTDADVDDGDFDGATPIVVDESNEYVLFVEDDLDNPGDRDFFSLAATQGVDYALQAATAAGDASPDTVVRIYGPDQAMIGENDDLPFRINGTDGGYVFRARETGNYYIEVLEWSDWAEDSPIGGTGWEYTLAVAVPSYELNETVDEANDNDAIAEELANIETLYDDDEANNAYSFFNDPWSGFIAAEGSYYWETGAIDATDDQDFFGIRYEYTDEASGDFAPGYISFSMFPGIDTDIDAVFTRYDGEGNELATTDDPEVLPAGLGVGYDVGINYLVLEPTDLFLEITDKSNGSGQMSWYGFLGAVSPYNLEVVTLHDLPATAEVDYKDATEAIMTESTATEGSYYGFLGGRLETGDDDFDSFHITAGVTGGNEAYVDCGTTGYGSAAEINIQLLDGDGTEIDRADDRANRTDDPLIEAIPLPSDVTSDLYVVINRDEGNVAEGPSAGYQCYVAVYPPE